MSSRACWHRSSWGAERAGGTSFGAGEIGQGTGRARRGAAGRFELRLRRRRQHHASGGIAVQPGRRRGRGATSARRSGTVPGLPTIAETALPGYEVTTWFALLAPAKAPGPVVNKLNSEITSLLTLPDIRERMLLHGAEVYHRSPGDLGDHIRREIAKWDKLIRESAARMDPP